jgi:anti-sigma factor RsiW
MHPRTAALVAFSDAEFNPERGRRIANHLRRCENCQAELRRIESEKNDLSSFEHAPAPDVQRGLSAVLSAIAGWQRPATATPELMSRVRAQIEEYFGAQTASMLEQPDIRADELLGRALALVSAFLGRNAAEAIMNDMLRELGCAGLSTEVSR